MDRFQLNQDWFQVHFDTRYRFQTLDRRFHSRIARNRLQKPNFTRFHKYFLVGFAYGPIPTQPRLIPGSFWYALTIPNLGWTIPFTDTWKSAWETQISLIQRYFLVGFAYGPIQTQPRLIPGPLWYVLSIPNLGSTIPFTDTSKSASETQIFAFSPVYLGRIRPWTDSNSIKIDPRSTLACSIGSGPWIYDFMNGYLEIRLRNPNFANSKVFLGWIRLWTDSNSTKTDSRSTLIRAIDSEPWIDDYMHGYLEIRLRIPNFANSKVFLSRIRLWTDSNSTKVDSGSTLTRSIDSEPWIDDYWNRSLGESYQEILVKPWKFGFLR